MAADNVVQVYSPHYLELRCPPGIASDVQEVWTHTVNSLTAGHGVQPVDRDSLLCYCEAVVNHRKASALLAKYGLMIKNERDRPIRNPALSVQRDSAHLIRLYAREFGFTPAARRPGELPDTIDAADVYEDEDVPEVIPAPPPPRTAAAAHWFADKPRTIDFRPGSTR
jgi:P27 family predicted phage terminase small subunit